MQADNNSADGHLHKNQGDESLLSCDSIDRKDGSSPSRDSAAGLIETRHTVLPKRVKRVRRMIQVDDSREISGEEGGRSRDVTHHVAHDTRTSSHEQTGKQNMEDIDDMVVQDLVKSLQRNGVEEKYEYLDHTADVQLHSWGDTLQESFENLALCMFNYMTPLKDMLQACLSNGRKDLETKAFNMSGNDMESLVYHWLDELLFQFSTSFFVPIAIRITGFDLEKWTITAIAVGGVFDPKVHACGTEIKAITYSAMQIYNAEKHASDHRTNAKGKAELYVIVDI